MSSISLSDKQRTLLMGNEPDNDSDSEEDEEENQE
jgi:hypothetical protein